MFSASHLDAVPRKGSPVSFPTHFNVWKGWGSRWSTKHTSQVEKEVGTR